ncbi:MAG: restriction endonuclease subunit S [Verrucomicrobiales bacterium]|nr:restriction endonuclease subunit S [Verrucomicrobiales bacterium]
MIRRGVLALNDGYRVRNVELGPVGIPFVRGGDIGDGGINTAVEDHIRPEFPYRVQSKLTRPFDVAFITKGTVGRVGMARPGQPQSVFAPQVCYWRSLDPDQLEPRFPFYLLTSAEFQANLDAVKTHGSMAADYVSMTDQRDFRLTFPPIREQKAIAAVLGALDDKIELNRPMNATLEAMARALFQN